MTPVRLALLISVCSFMVAGCRLPTNVFSPEPETQFDTNSAQITIQGLTDTNTVCYTTDGSEPVWNAQHCMGDSDHTLAGPVESHAIKLSCGSDSGQHTLRTVKLAFDWPNSGVLTMSANYFLDCSGPPGGSDVPVKIAFIGDTGAGSNFQSVLNLIKAEKVDLTLVAGDTAYSSSKDDAWDSMVRNTLGADDPAIVVAGNHDYGDSNFNNVRSYGQARLNRANGVSCTGSYAEQMVCQIKNVYLVLSAIGSEGSRSEHENFIESSLNNAPDGTWRICAWHKNQRNMQVGGKSDEVGWTAYETCRRKGAIIATGHEHSYSRTHLLSDMSEQTIASRSSTFTVSEGKTFAFVSGLGGMSIRDQERSGDWWASIYTSTQGARYGALFGTFYQDRAEFYFKNIRGEVIDQFTVLKGY